MKRFLAVICVVGVLLVGVGCDYFWGCECDCGGFDDEFMELHN